MIFVISTKFPKFGYRVKVMRHFTISVPEKESLFILKLLAAFKFVKITPFASEQISEEEKDLVRGILYQTREEDYLTLAEAKKEIEKVIER
jgi:hypothetical protein